MRIWWIILFVGVLAACDAGNDAPQTNNNTNSNNASAAPEEVVRWVRDPFAIVFRAEVVGGENEDAIYRKNYIPPCTIYGDGRIVWTQDGRAGNDRIVFDYLSDVEIANFITYLTVVERIFTYGEGIAFQMPTENTPVYEKLTIEVNDQRHVTDIFAEWDSQYFASILRECQQLSDTPTEFIPEGAWLSAVPVEYSVSAPSIFWDDEAAELAISDVASAQEKRWIEGRIVTALWRVVRDNTPDVRLLENDAMYLFALEVPGVTVDAPPAPVDDTATPEPIPLS